MATTSDQVFTSFFSLFGGSGFVYGVFGLFIAAILILFLIDRIIE